MIAAHQLHLRALVSGVPEPRRSGKVLVMLQALVDESDSHGERPRVFILGGYLSTVEKWERLTNAWRAELDRYPRLRYVAFKEAFPASGKPNGQFYGMKLDARDARIARFRKIIEDYAEAEIGVGLLVEDYRRAYGKIAKMRNNPYRFAMPVLLSTVAREFTSIGFKRQPIDFIFDDQKIEEPKVLDAWYYLKDCVKPDPPDLFDVVLKNHPNFRGSDDVIALQAADLFAGSTRAANVAELNGREAQPLPGTTKRLRGLFAVFNQDQLQEEADRDYVRLVAKHGHRL